MTQHHVLVTGGAGFIGSHAVEALLGQGHRVTVIDDFSTGDRRNLAAVDGHADLWIVEGDVSRAVAPQLAEPIERWGPPTHILHLAAQVSVALSVDAPHEDARRNLIATLHVLEFARACRAKKIVFSSSAAAYGDGEQPAHEGLVCQPLSPYGVHKYASELHLRVHAALGHGRALSFRFFNVYGPRQSPRSHYAGVISIFIGQALVGEPLFVFGTGEATRDFIYVADLVEAVTAGLFGGPEDGRALNLGTGRAISVRTLAETVIEVTGSKSPIVERPPRAGDILHSRADARRVEAELGWLPKTPLSEGLAATARWLGGGAGVYTPGG